MKWFRENAGLLALIGGVVFYLWNVFLDFGPFIKKDQVYAVEREIETEIGVVKKILSDSLLELADCVDRPQYDEDSDQAKRDPACQHRVLQALRKDGAN